MGGWDVVVGGGWGGSWLLFTVHSFKKKKDAKRFLLEVLRFYPELFASEELFFEERVPLRSLFVRVALSMVKGSFLSENISFSSKEILKNSCIKRLSGSLATIIHYRRVLGRTSWVGST